MPATNQKLTLPAGDTRKILLNVVDQAGKRQSLAGAVVFWWLYKGEEILVTKTNDAGLSISGSVVTISLAEADTKDLAPGAYNHRARVYFPNGEVSTVTTGPFTLEKSPGRRPA